MDDNTYIKNVKLGNKLYTLVDTYEWKDTIYHFMNMESEQFCYKKDNNYIKITNEEEIKNIKNQYGLNPPEVLYSKLKLSFKFSNLFDDVSDIELLEEDEKQKIINKTLKKIEELPININLERAKKNLNKSTMCKGVLGRMG